MTVDLPLTANSLREVTALIARRAARKSALAVFAALLIYLSVAVLTYRELAHSRASSDWTLHPREVLQACNLLLLRLTQAESAARDYAVSNDAQYLDDYKAASADIPARLSGLERLLSDNPTQTSRVQLLKSFFSARLEIMRQMVEATSAGRPDTAAALVRSKAGRRETTHIQEQIDVLMAEEQRLLTQRMSALAQHESDARLALLALAGLGVAFLILSWFFNRQALRHLRLAQAEANAGRAHLLTTLRSCGDGLIVTDEAGNVTLLNPVAQALTGWQEDQARGIPVDQVFRIVNEFTRETVESPVSRVLREGKIVGLANHTVLITREGTERPIDDSGAPIVGENGTVHGVVLVFRDVTSRKQSEQARERLVRSEAEREIALRANTAKDNFLALVSHELRSPLAAITGWVALLKQGRLTEPQTKDAIDRIASSGRLLTRIITDLVDVARIDSGKLEVVRSPINLVEVLRGIVEDCRPTAQEKGVQLEAQLPPLHCLIAGDAQRLHQVFSNLIGNAIKFSEPAQCVAVALVCDEQEAQIEVRDQGAGMDEEMLSHVFERFWQADPNGYRKRGGLGLGLTIAKHLVEQHEGTIVARSSGLGQGSIFIVTLPLIHVVQ